MRTFRVIELYSGIGGMHYAHAEAVGEARTHVVGAFDINDLANRVYRANFPSTTVHQRNIEALSVAFFEKLQADVILMSPPCQPYTRVGLQRGAQDERSRSFLHILSVLNGLARKPSYLLLENVRGFESSESRDQLVATLQQNGYTIREFLISPTQMNVPNSRLRYYLLAKRRPLSFDDDLADMDAAIQQTIPGSVRVAPVSPEAPLLGVPERDAADSGSDVEEKDEEEASRAEDASAPRKRPCHLAAVRMPPVCAATATLAAYLDVTDGDVEALAVPDAVLWKAGEVCDIVSAASRQSCCFTKAYGHHVEGAGSFLQQAVDGEVGEVGRRYHARLAAGDGPSSGPCPLSELRLRYFSDREVARLLGFPSRFHMPPEVARKQRYRLLGNSLSVTVVAELLRFLYRDRVDPPTAHGDAAESLPHT